MRTTRPVPDHRRPAPAASRRRPPRPMGAVRPARPAGPLDAEHAARASGGPDDTAVYSCGCGCAFRAAVTTSVTCPDCGTLQAW